MDQDTATRIFEVALAYCQKEYDDELSWAQSVSPETFNRLRSKQFLSEYCWVVYASGFRVSTIETIFPILKAAFKNFDLTLLARMRSLNPVLSVFNNERKASCFLEGSKLIARQGFRAYKKRLKSEGVDMLGQLPGIGPIMKFHLAKNIGLVDEAKPDIWLVRAANACSGTVEELVAFLSERYGMSRHAVDVILWRHGADNRLAL